MQLSEIFDSQAVALNREEVESNRIQFVGEAFFPNRKKMGIDLKWIRTHKGLGIALKPSNFDALSTIRTRPGIAMTKEEMPLFRESMQVREHDMIEVMRIQDASDPYADAVLQDIYDDTNNLIDGADIAVERMRMQLLSGNNGMPGITIGTTDNMIHYYNYDEDGSWKAKHYIELTGNDTWNNPTTSKPLNDVAKVIKYLKSIGVNPAFMLSTSATFDYLVESDQIKNSLISLTGTPINFMDTDTAEDVFRRKTKLDLITYDKMFIDYDGKEKNFYPDDFVTIIGSGQLGNTWYGTTPEERTLISDPKVDVTVLDRGVAIAVKTEYGPPVQVSTTASQIVLPSFEGMDSICVIKVK